MKLAKHTIFDAPIITPLLRWISIFILHSARWEVKGRKPDVSKYVMTAAPHTSNWDFVLVLLMAFALRIRIYIMAKKELVDLPFGFLFKYIGVIPVDRNRSTNTVEQAVELMEKNSELAILISPDGTRKKTDRWKTGFYHIARLADIPILFGYLDWGRKQGGVGDLFKPTEDMEADMKAIQMFYAKMTGKYPRVTA